ncbi:GNAT family N-acetyltransferase [Lentilactobacillus senioris]|uniref:GNAT family N-acetyltransferase n=1 Tax=Lentilactobacillus senioris TaxID=931534 RepID=UPI002280B742|nr:GNAT family N-acetyltransferase [Lentilactobacillus senioris]MCY9806609.1 GNAT family N-acetyltransferase [Lentilactobacillus senioris]
MKAITVRPLTQQDQTDYFQIVKEPAVQAGIKLGTVETEKQAGQILKQQLEFETVFGVVVANKVVGVINWAPMVGKQGQPDESNLLISYFLHPDYWNQGIMTTALKQILAGPLKNKTIWAETLPDNQASQRLLIGLNFQLVDEYTEPFAETKVNMYKLVNF